jgi:hypothetical protein
VTVIPYSDGFIELPTPGVPAAAALAAMAWTRRRRPGARRERHNQ